MTAVGTRQMETLVCSLHMPRLLAIACPGQGILPGGCLAALKPHVYLFQKQLDQVDAALGERFALKLLAPQSDEWNIKTTNAQPAIVAATYIHHHVFEQLTGMHLATAPQTRFLLGHSLGEYLALLLGGAFSLTDAVRLVRERAQLMATAAAGEYTMRVLVFKPALFDNVVATAEEHGVLACVNNGTQVSILGTPQRVDAAIAAINSPKKQLIKNVQLPVSIPFHNAALADIEQHLLAPGLGTLATPVVSNLTGKVEPHAFAAAAKCVSRPVQWKRSLEFVIGQGVTDIVNMGPGTSIDSINARFPVTNHPLKTAEDMTALANYINAH